MSSRWNEQPPNPSNVRFHRAAASGRMDIPKDDIDADHKLVEGKKYWDQSQAEWSHVKPIAQLGKEIMRTRN
ncbi:MAG: hypothetical protein ABWZ17_00675 [Candidatus Binatia bacterium]